MFVWGYCLNYSCVLQEGNVISLILTTYRPGGFDWFASSFNPTQLKNDGDDYEVVVVDDWPNRVGRGTVRKFLESKGVKVGWIGGSKPKSRPTPLGLANAQNTGLIHARGEHVVFVSDYTLMMQIWLGQWKRCLEMYAGRKALVSGSAIIHQAPPPELDDDVLTWQRPPTDIYAKWPWVPKVFETFYFVAPMRYFLEANGFDERSDFCFAWNVSSVIAQARLLGWELAVEQELSCYMIDHRNWPARPSPLGVESLWRIRGDVKWAEEEPKWQARSPNPFNLEELRRAENS